VDKEGVDLVRADRFGRDAPTEVIRERVEVSRICVEGVGRERALDSEVIEKHIDPALEIHGTREDRTDVGRE
jgi:hypothetical protein